MRRVACAACAALAFAPALSGCGERDEPEPAATPVETSDPVPELPRKWSRHVNSRAGFAVGLPPGWSARDRRRSSLLRSPDRLAAVAISADRTRSGLALPLDEFATRVADALKGFRRGATGTRSGASCAACADGPSSDRVASGRAGPSRPRRS
jgi:hypothetical protein